LAKEVKNHKNKNKENQKNKNKKNQKNKNKNKENKSYYKPGGLRGTGD
jgi:hypothetical protein